MSKLKYVSFFLVLFLNSCSSQNEKRYGERLCSSYSKEELTYFAEIAFGTEFTSDNMVEQLKDNSDARSARWYEDVKIKISGSPSQSDIKALNQVVNELNEIIEPIKIYIVAKEQNFNTEIKFIHNGRKSKVVDGDFEFEVTYYGSEGKSRTDLGRIKESEIIISDSKLSPDLRAHVIREEVTQSLGLFRDSDRYNNSIFNNTRNRTVTSYSEIDIKAIKILYNHQLPRYLKKSEFIKAISSCME
ncbi:hypothetical protein GCM10009122_12350 [Fulvivirga kasyanovii]|uniref:DUF2927 domain-containing protein n=1 Tax=Fulvivirga kasyanovii TaxID=396812 RepID=A0ABW9RNY8_9BACT|nr:DUF2927 domain-containing protein [Fulvivirga kasyanovii]MTI24675.1 DUF2927 domain-containing protein [Fulvivirga kasyanovii]